MALASCVLGVVSGDAQAPMTPEQLVELAQQSVDRARAAEIAILAAIAKRLAKGMADEKWAVKRLAELGALRSEVRRTVQVLARYRRADSKAILATAYMASRAEAEKTLAAAGLARAFTAKPEKAIAALTRDLEGRLASTDLRILRASEDIYRQVIGRVTAQGLEGEFTRRGAAQAALDMFADRGITGFVDIAGKAWSLPSYTETACRTAALNASRGGKLDSMRAAGNDLAIISGVSAGCELCSPWEGVVVSLDGTTPGYPTLDEAEGDGLFHPNCGHSADPYVEGVTQAENAPTSNPEMYEARQTQRGMERSIRQWKTRGSVALDDKTAAAAKAKVTEWQGKLREHVAANDLKRLSYREQIGKAI